MNRHHSLEWQKELFAFLLYHVPNHPRGSFNYSDGLFIPHSGKRGPTESIMAPLTPHWTQPSHPDIQEVVVGKEGEFTSKSLSKVTVEPLGLYAELTSPPCTFVEESTYATVQAGRDRHILLNSDLLYLNHSCEPSLVSAIPYAGSLDGFEPCKCLITADGDDQFPNTLGLRVSQLIPRRHTSQIIDTDKMQIFASEKGLKPGDELTVRTSSYL